jgi:hypothetical protein
MRFANVKALGAVSLIAPMTCLAPTTLRATSPAAPGSITADLKAERAKYDAQIAALERARAAALSTVRSAYVADLDDAGRKAVSTGKNEEAKATISKQTELVEQIRAEVRRANFDRAGPAGPIENNVVLNGDFAETQPNGMPTHWWLNGPGKAAVITEDGAKILRVASTSNSETCLRQPVKVPAGSKKLRVQLRVRAPQNGRLRNRHRATRRHVLMERARGGLLEHHAATLMERFGGEDQPRAGYRGGGGPFRYQRRHRDRRFR